MSLQTCGADARGVRVEWRNGGGRTRLVGVTGLGRMMGTDPNLALSVLNGLRRWEAGRSAGGMHPQRKGWVRLQDRAGETSNSSSSTTTTTSGERTPPPKAAKPNPPPPRPPRRNPASRVARKTPPPEARTKPKAKPKPKGKGKGKANPPPNPKPPLWRIGAGTPMGMC